MGQAPRCSFKDFLLSLLLVFLEASSWTFFIFLSFDRASIDWIDWIHLIVHHRFHNVLEKRCINASFIGILVLSLNGYTSPVSRIQYFLHLEVFGLEIIRFNIENDATVNSCCNKLMQAWYNSRLFLPNPSRKFLIGSTILISFVSGITEDPLVTSLSWESWIPWVCQRRIIALWLLSGDSWSSSSISSLSLLLAHCCGQGAVSNRFLTVTITSVQNHIQRESVPTGVL
jgi:hypothetical protein